MKKAKKLIIALLVVAALIGVAISNDGFRDGFKAGYNGEVTEQE